MNRTYRGVAFCLILLLMLQTVGCQGRKLAPSGRWPTVLLVLTNQGQMGQAAPTDGTGRFLSPAEPTGFYLSEAAHPWHVFNEAGWAIVLASPMGGDAPIDPRSLEDPDDESRAFLDKFARNGVVPGTARLAAMNARKFDAIFFVGGHGTMWDFPQSGPVKVAAEAVYRSGGVVAAVCHGPAALISLQNRDGSPLVIGKRVTGFTNAEEAAVGLTDAMPFLLESRLRELGAEFVGVPNFEANVVIDGRLVTGQNPASARETAEAVVRIEAPEQAAQQENTSGSPPESEPPSSSVGSTGRGQRVETRKG